MNSPLRFAGQAVVYLGFAALIGYFAHAPVYRHFASDQAVLTLSFAHSAKRKGDCRKLSREELEKLAPNMRKPVSCPRERLPVVVKIEIDGRELFAASLPPTGLSGDGSSSIYRKFVIPAGSHQIVASLRDSNREQGYDYQTRQTVQLAPAQNLALDFRTDIGGFVFY